jgi:flagellar hook-associated protein 1
MGNLFASVLMTTESLKAFGTGLNAVQSNISNISTPGYVKQTQLYSARPFDLRSGLPGGVEIGDLQSARNDFAENAVRRQQQGVGYTSRRADNLSLLEPIFPMSGNSGLQVSINGFFQSFSQLSVTPNSGPARQNVLDQASAAARGFQRTAAQLAEASGGVDRQIGDLVTRVNNLVQRLQQFNREFRTNSISHSDPGIDANVHATLEELSGLVNFDVLKREDGSIDLLLGGQTPVLIGDRFYPIRADINQTQATIVSAQGTDITNQLESGELGALLELRNETIPSYLADLDKLAVGLADQVNAVLANGLDQNGGPPVMALFTYDFGSGAAKTLSVNPLLPSDLAAASSGAAGGNGNALALGRLADAKVIDGYSFVEFYGSLAGRVGSDLQNAIQESEGRTDLLAQARSFREETSGVSLDEEAARLLQFQRAYEASARLLKTLDEMTETLVSMV